MILLSQEEATVFGLLDPSTRRRLVIGRTGRAFVWDPTRSTTEVSLEAARALVAQGIVGTNGRITPEHVRLWGLLGGTPKGRQSNRIIPPPRPEMPPATTPPPDERFERTLPMEISSEMLRSME